MRERSCKLFVHCNKQCLIVLAALPGKLRCPFVSGTMLAYIYILIVGVGFALPATFICLDPFAIDWVHCSLVWVHCRNCLVSTYICVQACG